MSDKKGMHEHREDDYSEPFRVVILEDCRASKDYGPAGNLTGQNGICLGEYMMTKGQTVPDLGKKATRAQSAASIEALLNPESEEIELVNPLILSYAGDYIWGIECFFSKADDLRDIPEKLWQKIPENFRKLLRAHRN